LTLDRRLSQRHAQGQHRSFPSERPARSLPRHSAAIIDAS